MNKDQTLQNDLLAAISAVLTSHGYLPAGRLETRVNQGGDFMIVARSCSEQAGKARLERAKILIETDFWKINHWFVHKGQRLTLVAFDERDKHAPWKATDGVGLVELSSVEMHAAVESFNRTGRPSENPKPAKTESAPANSVRQKPQVSAADLAAKYATWG